MKTLNMILSLLLCLALLTAPALAEELVEEVSLDEEGSGEAVATLPVDFSAGPAPSEAAFSESSYEDASISVSLEKVTIDTAVYCVARVRIADASQFRTAVTPKGRDDKISRMAAKQNAVIAIGGDYYGSDKGGYIVRQGEIIEKRAKPYPTRDLLCVDENGDFHIILRQRNAYEKKKQVNENFTDDLKKLVAEHTLVNVFEWGPALVIDGVKQEIPESYSGALSHRNPRCAIGQTGPLEYVLVVVDTVTHHDRSGKEGATGEELAQFMADLGCTQAYNLDGGNSALMVFHNQNYSDKTVNEERSVSDIIYFATAVQ